MIATSWSVFLDKNPRDGIRAGQGWQDRLRSELQSCRLVLAIITKDWLASRWCFTEAVTANFRGKDFVGVLPAALPDGALDIAPPVVHERQRQPLDLATGAGWDDLLHALDRSGLDPNQWFAIPEGVGPYPGFVAFEEKDAGVFFGRDQEITAYLDALNRLKAPDRAQALVISGGSGTGKSSLLKAGLIPRLRRQPDWLIIPPFDPSREPIHAFLAALRQAGVASGAELALPAKPPPTVEELTDHLQNALRAIEDKAQAWLLLPLDQAEVLLAGAKDGADTDGSRLLTAIGQLLASRRRKLVAVFTIRTEFMPALERALPPAVRFHDMSLRPISSLAEIIEKPAARFGIELQPGLAGRMVEDTSGADALPLLAYTLRELNEKYGDDKLLTVPEYEELGGVKGAIEQKLREALSDPRPTDQELAAFRRCFVRHLVRVDEGAVEGERYLRRAAARDALPDGATRLVERLLEARLLVGAEDGTISIAHERLIENWEDVPLRSWLAEDRDDRRLIESLKSRLSDHQQGGPFLTEKPLRDAEDLLARDPAVETDEPELAKFIKASLDHEKELAEQERQRQRQEVERAQKLAETERLRAEEQAQASRRNRRLAYIAGVLALISAGIGYFAFNRMQAAQDAQQIAVAEKERADQAAVIAKEQRNEAEHQRDQAFRNESQFRAEQARKALADGFPVTAMQLALAGLPDNPEKPGARPWVGETAGALVEAMGAQREVKVLHGHEGRVTSVAFSPQGDRIVSGGKDGTVRLWQLDGTPAAAPFNGHEGWV